MNTKVNIKKLRSLRKRNGFNQSEMAEIIGVGSAASYHRRETGEQEFSASELYVVAKTFNVPTDALFNGYNEEDKLVSFSEIERLAHSLLDRGVKAEAVRL